MKKKIVLIDGHSIINRAFYGVPELTNSQGLHTNGIYGFLNIMFKILEEEQPDYLTVAFDVKAPTFRHEMYEAYKGTRKGMPEELHEQVPVLKDVLHAMGICTVEKPGLEADDILGTIARSCEAQGMEVSLVSGDRDLLQIASDQVCIRIPKTRKGKTEIENYHTEDVVSLYQVTPQEFIDVKALMGDSSDNIPGVPGIGEKTASALIAKYHSIENVKAHLEEVKPARAKNALEAHYEMAELSKKLAAIKTDCELDYSLEAAALGNLFTTEAYEWIKRLEFKSMLSRFSTEEILAQEANEQQAWVVLLEKPEDLETFQDAVAACSRISFILLHDAADVCEASEIQFGGVFAGDTVYMAGKPELLERMIQIFTESSCQKVTVNLKRQLAALYRYGTVKEEEYEDTGIMAYLLNPLKDTYDYDDLARDYLNRMVASRKDILGKTSIAAAKMGSEDELQQMTQLCCQSVLDSFPVLLKALEESRMEELYRTMEMPLAFTLYSMQNYGIRADKEALKAYGDKLAVMIAGLEQEIYELSGEKFNINSPKQLGVILFEKMKLPAAKKTKTGYSTAADVLEKLRPDYPIVDKVLEYRQIAKLKSTYADGLAAFIKEDGRIHGNFHQTITATGRISSTEPNLQNIPIRMELGREIRRIFIPADGYVFVDADYSQIELRVLAHMSGDKRLIDAYNQAEDIHAITASQVFHVPLSEVTPQLRRNAKAVNFGIVYGISAFGLSEDLSITRKEAQEYMEQYFKTYPSIKEFLETLVKDAKEKGSTRTMFNRIRPVPELKSGNFMQRQFGERIAMNAPIQGTAADIIKIAMIRVDRRLKQELQKSRLLLQIHDELLVEAALEETEQVKAILKEEMTNAAKLLVALEIDMHTGNSWYDTK
ncbi:MAG: DNA polymerase I [Lachnospiraceae bacterium]|nr:DNA polymerase I [Lachnospiraceae bacterium]